MRCSIAWVLLFAVLGAHAQRQKFIHYNQLRSAAASLNKRGDYAAAQVLYDSAFALIPWVALDHVPAVLNALSSGSADRANQLLLQAVENGLDVERHYSPPLLDFLNTPAAQPFLKDWGYMQQRFLLHADTATIHELKSIGTGRRIVRGDTGEVIVRLDTTVMDRFLALVRLRGFPTAMIVGPASENLPRLLAEMAPGFPDTEHWQQLLPYINKEIARGTLEPEFLCLFQDIADHDHGRPLTYGVAMRRYLAEPHVRIASRSKVNAARAGLGLEPIEKAIEELETYPAKFQFEEDP